MQLSKNMMVVISLTGYTMNLHAADIDPGKQLLDSINRQEQTYQKQKGAFRWQLPKEKASTSNNTNCLPIKDFKIIGVTKLKPKEIEAIVKPFRKKCVTVYDVDMLLMKLTAVYLEKGYVTSKAFIGQQTIQEGILQITVSEGKIEKYTMNQNSLRDRIKTWAAFPSQKNEVLNLNEIAQGVSNLQNAPSSSPEIRMMPGTEFGKSIVDIQNKIERPVRFRTGYDNQGSSGTGKKRFRAGVEFDNLFAMNDTWSTYYLGSLDSNAFAIAGSIPFRNWDLSLSSSLSEYYADIGDFSGILTQARTDAGTLRRLLFRNETQKFFASFGLDKKLSTRQIGGGERSSERLTVAHLGLQYEKRLPNIFLSTDLGLSQGLRALGADKKADEIDSMLENTTPDPQFTRIEWNASASRFFEQFSLSTRLNSQWSQHPLYSSERINLGGVHSVRGFSEGVTAGDKGFASQNEFSLNPTVLFQDKKVQAMAFTPYVFLDAGLTRDEANRSSVFLSSTGIGVRYQWRGLSADLAFAKAFSDQHFPEESIHFNVDFRFW